MPNYNSWMERFVANIATIRAIRWPVPTFAAIRIAFVWYSVQSHEFAAFTVSFVWVIRYKDLTIHMIMKFIDCFEILQVMRVFVFFLFFEFLFAWASQFHFFPEYMKLCLYCGIVPLHICIILLLLLLRLQQMQFHVGFCYSLCIAPFLFLSSSCTLVHFHCDLFTFSFIVLLYKMRCIIITV